jgi:hypothetical protein
MALRGEARNPLASAMMLFSLFSWFHQISLAGGGLWDAAICLHQVSQILAHMLVRAPCAVQTGACPCPCRL